MSPQGVQELGSAYLSEKKRTRLGKNQQSPPQGDQLCIGLVMHWTSCSLYPSQRGQQEIQRKDLQGEDISFIKRENKTQQLKKYPRQYILYLLRHKNLQLTLRLMLEVEEVRLARSLRILKPRVRKFLSKKIFKIVAKKTFAGTKRWKNSNFKFLSETNWDI